MLLWAPVWFGIGVGGYFALPVEPEGDARAILAVLAVVALIGAVRAGLMAPIWWGVALMAAGISIASWRAHHVGGPVLGFRYYGPVEGRIIAMDRAQSGATRITLDHVRLTRMDPAAIPNRVRVALHGEGGLAPKIGMFVMVTANLSPPGGATEPGGFDFQRHAWFAGLGATGYSRSPLLRQTTDTDAPVINGLRMGLSHRISARLPDRIGGFAAAITTGDRSHMDPQDIENMRISNLAHLLAISGLHMGMLVGFVFGTLRMIGALMPYVALRVNIRRWAALGALMVGAVYLALSGGAVATERAFVMAAVALLAVMLDRQVISLRAVALAAMVVLILRPDTMVGPGFQMSFAATTALVVVFGAMRDHGIGMGPVWLRGVIGVLLSSFVAGMATAPFAAAHFNQVAHYGLLANMVSVPVMGIVVMPAAVLAAVLAPFGLEWIGLEIMGLGLRWILAVADWVAALPGARSMVRAPQPWVLPLFALGAITLAVWQSRGRILGAVGMALALGAWAQAPRPEVLIDQTGGLVGVWQGEARALSRPKGAGFAARTWLEHDGDLAPQEAAAARWPGDPNSKIRIYPTKTGRVIHVIGKRGQKAFSGCMPKDVVVFSTPYEGDLPCLVFDPHRLRGLGAVALAAQNGTWSMTSHAQLRGHRLWTSERARRRAGFSPNPPEFDQ